MNKTKATIATLSIAASSLLAVVPASADSASAISVQESAISEPVVEETRTAVSENPPVFAHDVVVEETRTAVSENPPVVAEDLLPACQTEDAAGPCFWDAEVQGNGQGRSFTVINNVVTY